MRTTEESTLGGGPEIVAPHPQQVVDTGQELCIHCQPAAHWALEREREGGRGRDAGHGGVLTWATCWQPEHSGIQATDSMRTAAANVRHALSYVKW